jgi:diguanylate cyclase (GGDEF)-like protein
MIQRLGIAALILLLTAGIAALEFAAGPGAFTWLLYFVPLGICGWYFSRFPTIVLSVAVTILFRTLGPAPCGHAAAGAGYTMPHLCSEYLLGTLSWLALFILWGLNVGLVRDRRRGIAGLGWESLTDSLTGLYNRRYLEKKLEEEKARSDRYKRPFTILMTDIDQFQKFNEARGPEQADILLAKVAGVLRRNLREIDVVCRYGGEEFLIILSETDGLQAKIAAERLRASIAETDMGVSLPITVSMGLATYPKDADSPQLVIEEAEEALRAAQASGGNRVSLAPKQGAG